MVATVAHPSLGAIRMLGIPVKLSETPGAVRTPPPRLGEHTRQVLRGDLSMSDGQIGELVASGAIRVVD
jgi:crotonobetainyl-CoA:carnitine CoA-transferase CaiB-like acyl-CoA transferase